MSRLIEGKNAVRRYTVRYRLDGRQREKSFATQQQAEDFRAAGCMPGPVTRCLAPMTERSDGEADPVCWRLSGHGGRSHQSRAARENERKRNNRRYGLSLNSPGGPVAARASAAIEPEENHDNDNGSHSRVHERHRPGS